MCAKEDCEGEHCKMQNFCCRSHHLPLKTFGIIQKLEKQIVLNFSFFSLLNVKFKPFLKNISFIGQVKNILLLYQDIIGAFFISYIDPRTIWHQDNLALGQFGTKKVKRTVWHRRQFGTAVEKPH